MTRVFPIFTILPGSTSVSDAVRLAHQQGAGLYLTPRGKVIVTTVGQPGWRRLPISLAAAA